MSTKMSKDEMELMDFLLRQANLFHDLVKACPPADSQRDPGGAMYLDIVRKLKDGWGVPDEKSKRMATIARQVEIGIEG